MEEQIKDVNQEVESSATPQAVETTEQPAVQEEQPQQVAQEVTPQPAPQGEAEVLDDQGVPWKNRAIEWKRKSEDLIEKLPSLVEEKIQGAFKQYGTTQPKEYTISELEQFAMQNPTYRPWVEEEKAKVVRNQLTKEMDERIQADRKRQEGDIRKQQALKYVMDTYSEAFVKDNQGKIVGWNNSHPLTQTIGTLMQDPRLSNDPDGLSVASDIAYARYVRTQKPVQQQKEQQLKQEVKNLQRQTLVEGGGKPSQTVVDPVRGALNKLRQTGSTKDAELAISEIFKRAKAKME